MPRFPITKAGFVRWLQKMEPNAKVCHSWGSCDCPLARYYYSRNRGQKKITIHPYQDRWSRAEWGFIGGGLMPLPLWAADFGRKIDAYNGRIKANLGATAERCLSLLT